MTLESSFEFISNSPRGKIKTVIFDFDGTISTLRFGWEEIMKDYMYEMIAGNNEMDNEKLIKEIKTYIDESMGVQTIYQMQWLKERVIKEGRTQALDIWDYKRGYNILLIDKVRSKIKKIFSNDLIPNDFRIKGSFEFIKELYEKGYKLYIASGTDHEDVVKEMRSLEVFEYFEKVKGAPSNKIQCPKESIVSYLLEDLKYKGNEVLIIGDGKVEIQLARKIGGKAIGMATEEKESLTINERKRKKLIEAGANIIIPNFLAKDKIISWIEES